MVSLEPSPRSCIRYPCNTQDRQAKDRIIEFRCWSGHRALLVIVLLATLLAPQTSPFATVIAQDVSCANYDAWIWAQTVYDSDPVRYSALDRDGNGLACPELSIHGFAPTLWTNGIPADAEAAQLARIVDGDTFHVTVAGVDNTIRMYHMNTPETQSSPRGAECGGDNATSYLQFVLGFAPGGTVYLEYDKTKRDQYDRRLAWVWYQIGSDVYMVNEAMVRSGWAESKLYKPDDKYTTEMNEAEQFSVQHVLGVRLECGKFGKPVGSQPSREQVQQAMKKQPNQGQFDVFYVPQSEQNAQPVVAVQPTPASGNNGNCDPAYPTVCIPPPPPDLDCKDITFRRFQVLPPDPHHFDGDNDGIGCESG